jgi:hypothetical protein
MAQADFTAGLEQELQLRGITLRQADLLTFVSAAWPLIKERPDPAFWVRELVTAASGSSMAKVFRSFAR